MASKEIFSPSNKIHGEIGRAKDLSAPLYLWCVWYRDAGQETETAKESWMVIA